MQEGIHISYNNNLSWSTPTILPKKVLDPYIYIRLQETSTDNTPWDNYNYSDETYLWAKQRSEDPSIPGVRINPNDPTSWEYMGGHIDWTEYFLNKFAFSQMHHIAIDGRSSKTSYYLSGSYNTQAGAIKMAKDAFDRYNFRSNINYSLFDWLKIGNNTLLTMTERANPYYLSLWDIYNVETVNWDKNPDDSWANSYVGRTAARISEGGKITDKYTSFQTTFTGEASFWKGVFRINSDFTIKRGASNYNSYQTKYKIGYGPDDIREEGNNNAYRSGTFNYSVFNIYGTFDKLYGKHQITAVQALTGIQPVGMVYGQKRQSGFFITSTIQLTIRGYFCRGINFRLGYKGYSSRTNYIFNENISRIQRLGMTDHQIPSDNRFGFSLRPQLLEI